MSTYSDPEAEGLPDYADDETDADGQVIADGPDHAPLPHDTPLALDRYGTTAEEARQGEPMDYKLAQEEPDTPATTTRADRGGPGIEPHPDSPVSVYDRPDLRLDSDRGPDRRGGPTAEEAAMHEIPD